MAEYFQESPKAIDTSMFPTWPAKSELAAGSNNTKKAASPKPPSGKYEYTCLRCLVKYFYSNCGIFIEITYFHFVRNFRRWSI